MMTYQNNTFGNIAVPGCLQLHDDEEADTWVLLHVSTTDKDTYIWLCFGHRYFAPTDKCI